MAAMGFKEKAKKYVKAPFGYPGGKTKSLKHILPLLPVTSTYVEVFGGSGVVLLNRPAVPIEVFNDRHSGLTDFYRCLHDPLLLAQLISRIETTIHSREFWHWCKETWEEQSNPVDRGFRWYYMVRYSFSQMSRHFGRSTSIINRDSGKIIDNIPLFPEIHRRLKNVLVENQDWRELFRDFDSPTTVFYLDPPYYDTNMNVYKHEFTKAEHKALLDAIFGLRGYVALSGYDNELYNGYKWDRKETWDVRVNVGGNAANDGNNREEVLPTGTATEVLWIKNSY